MATLWGIAVVAPFLPRFLPVPGEMWKRKGCDGIGRRCSQVSLSMASGENLHMTLSGSRQPATGRVRGRGRFRWLECVYLVLFCAHTHAPSFCVIFSKLYYSFSAPSLTLLFFSARLFSVQSCFDVAISRFGNFVDSKLCSRSAPQRMPLLLWPVASG